MCSIETVFTIRIKRAVFVAIAILSCIATEAREIVNTEVLGRKEAYWIDNYQVLFPGYDASRVSPNTGKPSPQSVIYIWDQRIRKATTYADIPEGDYVCFSDGYISYAIRRNGKRFIRQGRLGAETEKEWVRPISGSKVDRNEITCRDFDYSMADSIYPGFLLIPLRVNDGYYGWRKKDADVGVKNAQIHYLPAGTGKKPIAVPIPAQERDRVSYSQYFHAYVFEYTPSQRNDDSIGTVRILYTIGKVDQFAIPAGLWMRGSMQYVPSKMGIVMASHAAGLTSSNDPGHAGLYQVRQEKVELLISGFPGRPAVSPDGCKVAVVVNPLTGPGLKATLRIVDLCKEK